ncbi:MAG TPA: cyclopropane fatty acyl phospholipid synthase [Polyangia bacterium]
MRARTIERRASEDAGRFAGQLVGFIDRQLWRWVASAVAPAGITIDGPEPWDPQVRDPRFVRRMLLDGTVGVGESYVDGQWECAALDELTARLLGARAVRGFSLTRPEVTQALASRLWNRQSRSRARASIESHYDRGDALYRAMLGRTMVYSCGYWPAARDLDEAQEAKLELACRKLQLEPGLRVLDIGCGWGAFARHAAERYRVRVVGVTVSPAQAASARALCRGLPVEIRLKDYRDLDEPFDRIVSIGMFEHVGARNHDTFFRVAHRCLKPGGLFLLHSIGNLTTATSTDPWIDRYIFPGALLPSARQIARAIEGRFVLEDWHNFGADYDRTLRAWHDNFEAAWPTLAALGDPRFDERFRRTWRFYLLTCAGSFRSRHNQLWQLVLSKGGVPGGYRRPHL